MDKPSIALAQAHKGCECGKKTETRAYYRYYDTPDGQDIEKKIFVTTRYGVIVGLIASAYDVLMYSHASKFTHILKRCMLHTVPLGLMGATFAAVANGVQHMRGEDDSYNYFIGGFACGPILAAYLGSGHAVILGGLLLGVAGAVKKYGVEHGHTFFPQPPRPMNLVNGWRNDWTLTKDPRDDWIRQCAEQRGKR